MTQDQANLQSFPQISAPFVDDKKLITYSWRQLLQSMWKQINALQSSISFFPGLITLYGGPSLPTGWFLCDGSAISRSTYSALFAAIGTTWGAGNGTTTFNVPNLVDKFVIGGGASPTLGTTGGNANVTLAAGNLPAATYGTGPASNVTSGAAAGGVTGSITGTATPFSVLPPFAAVYYIIKQ
jgi:Phage Tail Collar Domain